MMNAAIRYVTVLAVLAAGDALWLSYFAKSQFRPTLGPILLDDPRWKFAIAFYLIFALGVVVFPVAAGLRAGSLFAALAYGAFFGLLAYATYDLTNLATIKAWTVKLALMDMAWGTMLTGIAAAAGCWIRAR
jgi:uncharacterized membrane protein